MRSFFGSIERELDGKPVRLTLDMNAVCHFDEATGLNFFEVVKTWEDGRGLPPARQLRAIVHAALQEHHPDMTAHDAGRLMSADMTIFGDLMAAAMKGIEAGDGGKKKTAAA